MIGNNTVGNSENGITYDQEGNISSLKRYSIGTLIDNLTYNYTLSGAQTNQLQSVADASGNNSGLPALTTSYSWDANGNMLSAANSTNTAGNKSFTYNLLNLPATATFATGSATFAYDAAGTKLRKASTAGSTTTYTDYIAGIQHSGTSSEPIQYIMTEEGQAAPTSATSYDYQYFLGDNLGNTRESFGTKTGVAAQYQRDDYYAFGMEIAGVVTSPKNEYLYNKKELQSEFAEYDYEGRFYDPVIARWTSIDPMAEVSRRWSTYNYVMDNPIRLIDPDGMFARIPGADVGEVDEDAAGVKSEEDQILNEDNFWQQSDNKLAVQNLVKQAIVSSAASAALSVAGFGGDKPKPKKKEDKHSSLSSKFETGTNILAGVTMVALLGPEDPIADIASGLEELVGQTVTGLIKLGELAGDLWPSIHFIKGERGQAGSAGGTNNPFKKLKPDPDKPGNVLEKDSHTGQTKSKIAPPGFREWWNGQHPDKPI